MKIAKETRPQLRYSCDAYHTQITSASTMINFKAVLCLLHIIITINASKYHPKIISVQIIGHEIYEISHKALLNLIKNQFKINDDYGVNDKVNAIETLDLSGNNIQSFERNTFNFPNLRTLILTRNDIESIETEDFYGLYELNDLNLSDNELSEVSSIAFAGMIQLTKLNFNRNCLTKIDFVAPGLNYLNMRDNQISEVRVYPLFDQKSNFIVFLKNF